MEIAVILMGALAMVMAKLSIFRWLSPSVMLSGSWAIVFLLQSVFASDMYSSIYATMLIFIITLCFSLGEIVGLQNKAIKITFISQDALLNKCLPFKKNLKSIVVIFGVASIIGSLEYARALGIFDGNIIETLLAINVIREQIFTGEISASLISKVGILFGYSGVVLALSYYYYYEWRWWLLLPVISILIIGISQAGRAGIMIVLLQGLITMLLKKYYINRKTMNLSGIFIPVLILMLVFYYGQLFREGFSNTDDGNFIRVAESLRAYLFGGVSAFSYYVENFMDLGQLTFGRYSFSSLFAALGIYSQEAGVYDQYAIISPYGETSNLYTAYRSFLDDFSLVGAILFYFLSGFFITRLYILFITKDMVLVSVLIPALSWLVFSPMYSLTYFNSFLLSCFFPYFILRKIFTRHRKKSNIQCTSSH